MDAAQEKPHNPVLLSEMIDALAPQDGHVYVDGTFGAGGYSTAILEAADCTLIGIDRDETVMPYVSAMREKYKERFLFQQGKYSEMEQLLNAIDIKQVNGVVLDIGVSSMQIDTPERGFSFMHDGDLDMRMGQHGISAKECVNDLPEGELANIIYQYGGERKSRKIARAIVEARQKEPITRTKQLADIVQTAVRGYNDSIHPATRTFQAIRIWVNNELDEITQGLQAAKNILADHGKLVVVSFHSLEDAIVKKFLQQQSGKNTASISRYMPMPAEMQEECTITFTDVKKPVKPSRQQVQQNPRCRSAILRCATRIQGEGQCV